MKHELHEDNANYTKEIAFRAFLCRAFLLLRRAGVAIVARKRKVRMKTTLRMMAGAMTLGLAGAVYAASATTTDPRAASKQTPWENSLGMRFVPVKDTEVLFCIWLTRVQDFTTFVRITGHDAKAGMYSLTPDGIKQGVNTWDSPGFQQGLTHPVSGVNWEDAQAFCKWLTKQERDAGRLPSGYEYRLPKDAEWSAAVGLPSEFGKTPKEKHRRIRGIYPWGMEWPPPIGAGNFSGTESKVDMPADREIIRNYTDPHPRTSTVGSYVANPLGLYDMSGNLWEWCEDIFTPNEPYRVLRGGAWNTHDGDDLLSSSRNHVMPGIRAAGNGFRCVLAPAASP
ncbi:MAG: formylglycine-generating enzyme family protein [Verrucomicrobia bacterium]|nr:formylglycine-generating enzyme family protein [Verrucomicrobiota bacterium]